MRPKEHECIRDLPRRAPKWIGAGLSLSDACRGINAGGLDRSPMFELENQSFAETHCGVC